jgi:hypothetical protein
LDQLKSEKAKLHKEKVDLENQLEAEQVCVVQGDSSGQQRTAAAADSRATVCAGPQVAVPVTDPSCQQPTTCCQCSMVVPPVLSLILLSVLSFPVCG